MSESQVGVEQGQVNTNPAEAVSEATSQQRAQTLQQQIERVTSVKLKNLLEREAQLKEEIDRLSSIDAESEKMRLKEAELQTVRAEKAKREEDLASLSYAMAAEMEAFGQLSGDALEDKPEDIEMREAAHQAVADAQNALADEKAAVTTGESKREDAMKALATAQTSWNFFTKGSRISNAKNVIASADRDIAEAKASVAPAETSLQEASDNIAVVEEQIRTNKKERLRKASLVETYSRIGKWVSQAKKVLKSDIAELQQRIVQTKQSKTTAIERRVKASERIRAANGKIADLEVELLGKQNDRDDITDRTDPTYQKLNTEISELTTQLDMQTNELKLAESGFSDAEIAVKERDTSIMALTAQSELAKNQYNKFVISEESAIVIGQNIEVLVKGADREVINESLDKGVHKMTVAIYDLSKKTAISSVRQLNDMGERKIRVLQELEDIDQEAEAVLADELGRNAKIAQTLREGYEKKGLDVENLSSLAAAAALAKQVGGVEEDSSTSDELF